MDQESCQVFCRQRRLIKLPFWRRVNSTCFHISLVCQAWTRCSEGIRGDQRGSGTLPHHTEEKNSAAQNTSKSVPRNAGIFAKWLPLNAVSGVQWTIANGDATNLEIGLSSYLGHYGVKGQKDRYESYKCQSRTRYWTGFDLKILVLQSLAYLLNPTLRTSLDRCRTPVQRQLRFIRNIPGFILASLSYTQHVDRGDSLSRGGRAQKLCSLLTRCQHD